MTLIHKQIYKNDPSRSNNTKKTTARYFERTFFLIGAEELLGGKSILSKIVPTFEIELETTPPTLLNLPLLMVFLV